MEAAVKLRSFESGYKNLVASLLAQSALLSSEQYGQGSAWIRQLLTDHAQYHVDSRDVICRGQELFHFGESIATFGADSVVPKCRYLETIICQINQATKQRRERLERSLEIAHQIEQAQAWWEKATTMLSNNAADEVELEAMIASSTKLSIFEHTKNDTQNGTDTFATEHHGERISSVCEKVRALNEQYVRLKRHQPTPPKPVQHVEPRLVDPPALKTDYPPPGLSRSRTSSVDPHDEEGPIPKEVTSSDMSEEEKPRIRDTLSSSQVWSVFFTLAKCSLPDDFYVIL